jgi:hypothetical protein
MLPTSENPSIIVGHSRNRRRFFIIESTPLSFVINISGAEGARHSMAIKSSNKPRKTPSSKQGTAQTKSSITPIAQASSGTDSNSRGFHSMDQRIKEEIRIRAYELFEQRGRQEGFHDEDWARAEAEVVAKYRRDRSA